MFAEFLNKDEFYRKYMNLFASRFAIGNLEMENPKMSASNSTRTIEMYNNMNAFMNLIEQNKDRITPTDIMDVADEVNRNINFFSRGFRRTQVEVRKAENFTPPPACEVYERMYALCDAYNNIWDMLPTYEREARFHMDLVRIQPFEDGNKRTARILTSFNLCKQNKAPIVIGMDENDEYFDYIDKYDIEGFTKFLEKKSKEELEVMLALYKSICGDSFEPDNMTSELGEQDIHIYEFVRDRKKPYVKK